MQKLKTEVHETWLPVFNGFYESPLIDDDDMEYKLFNDTSKVDKKVLDFILENCWEHIDYTAYRNALSEVITDCIGDSMIEQNLITGYMFENLSSPREYNFRNDSINILAECNIDQLIIRCLAKMGNADIKYSFWNYIKESYTSYDGFSSSYTNNPYLWLAEIYDDGPCNNDHKIGSMLQYLIDFDNMELYEACNEVYITEFIDYEGLIDAVNCEFGDYIKEFSDIEDGYIPGKKEKTFLQLLTGIGLFTIDPAEADIDDLKGPFGLNNTNLLFV